MSTNAIKFIEANPRSTAKEAGLTTAEANALVGQGKLVQAGHRKTGKKGRPPVEYVVVGYDFTDDPQAAVAVEKAQERVRAHRAYERLSNAIMRAANEHGHGSEQHIDAKALRAETFLVLPELPSKNDYVLAGVIEADPIEAEDDELVEA
jgi:hypothetical protein